MKKIQFKGFAFLKDSRLDRFGSKFLTFEFSADAAIEIAKLELMSRDLIHHLPVLLKIGVSIAEEKDKKKVLQTADEKPAQKRKVPGRKRPLK